MGQKYGSFLNKYKFSGIRGEDREKIDRNWPFAEPKLNCAEDRERKGKREKRVK